MLIAVSGKGSAGKSTLIPFLAAAIRHRHPAARLLVVDADPHQTATRLLGLPLDGPTLGQLRSAYEHELARGGEPRDETRDELAERVMFEEAVTHADGFDFLALGQWSLPGSQCTPNLVLEKALAAAIGVRPGSGAACAPYDITLIDHEAGLEHIGRFVSIPIDVLLLVSLPHPSFLDVAARIAAHARHLRRAVRRSALILNRVQPGDLDDELVREQIEAAQAAGVEYAGDLPECRELARLDRPGRSVLDLGEHSPWRLALDAALERSGVLAPPLTALRARAEQLRAAASGGVR